MVSLLIETIVAVFGTMSFSVLFGASKKYYLACGIIGGVGWFTSQGIKMLGISTYVATFFATFILVTLCRAVAARLKAPTIVFLLCGIFTLVPGAGIYYTAYNFFVGEGTAAVVNGLDTIKTAISIALGIALCYSIPASVFGWSSSPSVWNDNIRTEKSKDKTKQEKR